MKNTFGQSIAVTLFGESHGEAIGAVIDGIAPGIKLDRALIESFLLRRRPSDNTSTSRAEADNYAVLSGVFNEKTTGTPIAIIIPNTNTVSSDYTYGVARPSHADYAAFAKYGGYEDYRGGGHFSGRLTAALTAAGAVLTSALNNIGVYIGTHIYSLGNIKDRNFDNLLSDINYLSSCSFPALDSTAAQKMQDKILSVAKDGNSIGGITQTVIYGLPAGVGEPWFDTLEGVISHAVFSVGGIKGIEFGAGFSLADMLGSEANDSFRTDGKRIFTVQNNSGGINGGISNGMPVVFQCAVKPTPSISKTQQSVDFVNMKNADITVSGRHDPAIIRRVCPVIDSVTAIAVCNALALRYGTDVFCGGKTLCASV